MKRTAKVLLAAFLAFMVVMPAVAQTKLKKKINRRFPQDWCPMLLDANDQWSTSSGIVEIILTFEQGFNNSALNMQLDDFTIIEVDEFTNLAVNAAPCPGEILDPVDLMGNPKVPFYERFDPVSSTCPWDESDGGAIGGGVMAMADPGMGGTTSTRVIVGGLDPAKSYVFWGMWTAINFDEVDCTDDFGLCLDVEINEVTSSCTLPVEESTWGAIKSLFDQ